MRLKGFLITYLLLISQFIGISSAQASPPQLKASAAILMDPDTGRILYEQNSQTQRAQASTTKITTAMVALQDGGLDEQVTVSSRAAVTKEAGIQLQTGERLSLKELVQALLVYSANDAAVAIAEHVGGGQVDQFVARMNQQAKVVGAKRTHYVNPHGLDAPDHYSTAQDLALLARYAILHVPGFDEIIHLKEIRIHRAGLAQPQVYANRNKLLDIYAGADGVKTGTTDDAGKCLVSSATRQGHRLIGVVLNSPDVFGESARLLDHGFEDFQFISFATPGKVVATTEIRYGQTPEVPLTVTETITVPIQQNGKEKLAGRVNLTKHLEAPLSSHVQVGTYQIMVNNQVLKEIPLITSKSVDRQNIVQIFWSNLITWLKNLV